MMRCLILFLLLLGLSATTALAAPLFAVAVTPTPVLNRPDFRTVFGGKDGRTLLKDDCGQIRAVEFVALPGTVFTIHGEAKSIHGTVYRVTTADYPYPLTGGYFVDSRSVRLEREKPPERSRNLPSKEAIVAAMKKRVGTGYIWGGNLADGVPQLTEWYPPAGAAEMTWRELKQWSLAGVDCSGLLYEATGGYTPRNTSSLVRYGQGVSIAGKTAAAIAAALEPLDLIVWTGHVLIVIDGGNAIESRLICGKPEEGVRIRPLKTALADIMRTRRPVDIGSNASGEFVIRRWHGILPGDQ